MDPNKFSAQENNKYGLTSVLRSESLLMVGDSKKGEIKFFMPASQ